MKYTDKNKNEIQVAKKLYKFKTQNDINDIHISAIWSYDPIKDITDYQLILKKDMSINEKNLIFNHFKINNTDSDLYNINFKGINSYLN